MFNFHNDKSDESQNAYLIVQTLDKKICKLYLDEDREE
jgi:hypothetical protein